MKAHDKTLADVMKHTLLAVTAETADNEGDLLRRVDLEVPARSSPT